MKILQTRKCHENVSYYRHFGRENDMNSGYCFDCDEHGNVSEEMKKKPSYIDCINGFEWRLENVRSHDQYEYSPIMCTGEWKFIKLIDRGVEKVTHNWSSPAIGECNGCGEEIHLLGFTNTCDCGLDYNMSGQQLAPREQWGDDTGESLGDILRIQ